MAGERIFTRDFVIVMGITFFCVMNYFFLLINITRYAEVEFGADASMGGVAAGIYVIGGLLSRIFIGKYIELVGRKRMLVAGLSFALVMSVSYFLVSSFAMLLVVRFLHGLAYGMTSTCSSDIAAKLVPQSRRGEGLGYYGLCFTIASAIGPLIGLWMGSDEVYDDAFAAGVAMYAMALMLALVIHVPDEVLTEEQKAEARSFDLRNLFEVTALPLALTVMVFYFSYSGVLSFISSFTDGTDLEDVSGIFFIAVALGTLVSRLNAGRIFDQKGPNRVMYPAFLAFIVGMALYATTQNAIVFMFAGFLIGIAIAIVFSTLQAIVVAQSPPRRYGVTTSTFSALNDLGSGVGPMVLGTVITAWGYSDMYLLCACIAVVSMLMYWSIYGRKHGSRPGREISQLRDRGAGGAIRTHEPLRTGS